MNKKIVYYLVLAIIVVLLIIFGTPEIEGNPMHPITEYTIENYLENNIISASSNGKIFSTYDIFKYDFDKKEVYLWAVIQEYQFDGEYLQKGTGISGPLVLKTEVENNSTRIVKHMEPRSGAYYQEDIEKLFPRNLQKIIFNYSEEPVKKLLSELESKVGKSFADLEKVQVKNIKEQKSFILIDSLLINELKKAMEEAVEISGIVNTTNPEYELEIDGERYYFWLNGNMATMMNVKNTNTIYSLSENASQNMKIMME